MTRGFFRGLIGIVCLAATVALVVPGSASAKPADRELQPVLSTFVSADATNGYYFILSAFRGQPGGATVTASFFGDTSSVQYIRRSPAVVTKHRIKADLGDLGSVDLKVKRGKERSRNSRCGRQTTAQARLKGGLVLDTAFSHVRSARLQGFVSKALVRRRCAEEYGPPIPFNHQTQEPEDIQALTSCDRDSGIGLVALKQNFDNFFFSQAGTTFLATASSREDGLEIISTTAATGAARNFGIRGRAARVNPPEPFSGRAQYRNGQLTGNLRVDFPGTKPVPLAPAKADLGTLPTVSALDCIPGYFTIAGRSAAEQAVAAAVPRAALTPGARRALSALGDG